MPSRRLSLASGHSGSQSCSKRPSGRLLGLIGRLSHTSVHGRSLFLGVFIIRHEPSQMFPGFGGSPKGFFQCERSELHRRALPLPLGLTRRRLRLRLATELSLSPLLSRILLEAKQPLDNAALPPGSVQLRTHRRRVAMGTNARKIIGLLLLLFCAQVLVATGLGEVLQQRMTLSGLCRFSHWNLNLKKTTKPAVLVSYRCHTEVSIMTP